MTQPRILFLCHSASRNGATLLLLDFLRWLRAEVDWRLEILIDGRGPLVEDFRAIGRTIVLRDAGRLVDGLPARTSEALRPRVMSGYARTRLAGARYDLVYANTAATWPLVHGLTHLAPARLWHIHELDHVLRMLIPSNRIAHLFGSATGFVAASSAVRETLVKRCGIARSRIDLVHSFVPCVETTLGERCAARARMRGQLGWGEDAFVVGGCGSLGWRKGTDLFLQIARTVTFASAGGDVRFLWVGGGVHERLALEFDHDVRTLGLEGRCARIPATSDVADYYPAMDALALTSREDPFPLVMLEAAAHGVPTVCFADAGGGAEFVGSDAGLVAPYLDVAGFAEEILTLHERPVLREALGEAASRRVRAHFTTPSQAPKLVAAINRCLATERVGVDRLADRRQAARETTT